MLILQSYQPHNFGRRVHALIKPTWNKIILLRIGMNWYTSAKFTAISGISPKNLNEMLALWLLQYLCSHF